MSLQTLKDSLAPYVAIKEYDTALTALPLSIYSFLPENASEPVTVQEGKLQTIHDQRTQSFIEKLSFTFNGHPKLVYAPAFSLCSSTDREVCAGFLETGEKLHSFQNQGSKLEYSVLDGSNSTVKTETFDMGPRVKFTLTLTPFSVSVANNPPTIQHGKAEIETIFARVQGLSQLPSKADGIMISELSKAVVGSYSPSRYLTRDYVNRNYIPDLGNLLGNIDTLVGMDVLNMIRDKEVLEDGAKLEYEGGSSNTFAVRFHNWSLKSEASRRWEGDLSNFSIQVSILD